MRLLSLLSLLSLLLCATFRHAAGEEVSERRLAEPNPDISSDSAARRPSPLPGRVELQEGKLLLEGTGYLVAARSKADATRVTLSVPPPRPTGPFVPETPAWPDNPPDDWLTFHLAHPGPGPAFPGDPNCIFDYKGLTHLHYIYRNAWGFVFGHVSSNDMVHWGWSKTVLAPPGCGIRARPYPKEPQHPSVRRRG